ncbi:hypothetical protein NX794_13900 [Streptomyces sp. LP11]|uniref:Uncharacterized protein n=1 Tax=Streptomyces pyxinicus TaxID=2970331 RepID=A0ABT2B1A4_9ACTN|nr:hypothetical protein [Streptomyces sp. LP11]MCS0602293.1 hypothetical protein [Streptomyces sp. LP11]
MITAVGHADLAPDTLRLVEAELGAVLERLPGQGPGLVRAGAGTPLAFGRAARVAGRPLVVLTPTRHLVPAPPPAPDRLATGELLMLAGQVRLLEYDPADRDACVGADERMIADCRRLLAVWDGSPSNGRDATAHLVAYARAHGVPTEVIWPEGAVREPIAGPPPLTGTRRTTTVGAAPTRTLDETDRPR